jgi:nucleotide-binding universal stress UspA family protein
MPTLADAPHAGHTAMIADHHKGPSRVDMLLANGIGHVALTDWKSSHAEKEPSMSRILVATDGSAGADRAIDYAARRATREGADLVIVNVIGGYGLPDKAIRAFTRAQGAWLREELASLSTEILTKARDRARKLGVRAIRLESQTGEVAPTILRVAKGVKADAVVVGKRGAGRVRGLLLRSVAQKLVSLAPVPVTVVP